MNTLNTQKPSIVASFIRIFIGAICCFGFVLKILELINGPSEPFEFSSIVSCLVGMVLVGRGINGILLHSEDRPLPKSFSCYIWLVIGVPILISLWGIFLGLVDLKEFWPYLFSVFPVIVGLMAIGSVYEGRSDAYYLIKCYVIIYVTSMATNILTMIIEPTPANGIGLAIKLLIASVALSYLYKSKTVEIVFPISERSTSKVGRWITTICIGVISAFTLYFMVSLAVVAFEKEYDPSSMTEQYNKDNGYYTDGIVAFKLPSHYTINETNSDGMTIFSIADSDTEPTETITVVSELNYELTAEEFNEYYEAWQDEDFAYLSTTVVKDQESVIEGKHYRHRSVYFKEYGTYWDFAIVNQPDINKNCLISIYTSEPEKRVFFFIRNLKFM